jgi:hypothetical protein
LLVRRVGDDQIGGQARQEVTAIGVVELDGVVGVVRPRCARVFSSVRQIAETGRLMR